MSKALKLSTLHINLYKLYNSRKLYIYILLFLLLTLLEYTLLVFTQDNS